MKKALLFLLAAMPAIAQESPATNTELLPASAATLFAAPPVMPPAEHPRLMLRESDVPALRETLEHPANAEITRRFRRLVGAPVSGKLDPAKQRTRKGLFSPTVLAAIQCKAFNYVLAKDEATGREAVQAMEDYLDTAAFEQVGDVTREIGHMIYVAALVYDWCYPLFTSELREKFIRRGEEFGAQMEIGMPPVKQSNITSHAGEAQLLRDLLSFGVAVYDEKPTLYLVTAGRFFQEMVPARNFFYPSGRHHQGANLYAPYRLQWDLWAAWIFRRMGAEPVYADASKIYREFSYLRLPDGSFLPDGDFFLPRGRYMGSPDFNFLYYTYFNDPYAKAEFQRLDGMRSFGGSNIVDFLLLDKPALAAIDPDALPLANAFRDPIGALVVRNGWGLGRASDIAVVEVKGGGYCFGNHMHTAAGSFQIYYKGMLATDPGQYGAYGTPYDWGFTKAAISHNVILVYDPDEKIHPYAVNDGGQRRTSILEPKTLQNLLNDGYESGTTLAMDFGPNLDLPVYAYIKSDLAAAYSDKIKEYTRSAVHLNFSADDNGVAGALIVFDRVVTRNPEHKKYWIMHTLKKPEKDEIGTNGTLRTTVTAVNDIDEAAGKLKLIPLLPEEKNRTIGFSPSVEFFGHKFEPPFPNDPTGQSWRTDISPITPAAEDLFLNVMLYGDLDKPLDLPVERIEGETFVGVYIDNYAVFFSRDGKPFPENFTLPIPRENMRVIVTDISGSWSTGHGITTIAADKGTLFFVSRIAGECSFSSRKPPKPGKFLPSYAETIKAAASVFVPEGITIDGKKLDTAVPLRWDGLILMAPAETLIEATGAKMTVEGQTVKIVAVSEFTFSIGSDKFTADGFDFRLDAPVKKLDGTLYFPAVSLARLLGFTSRTEPNVLALPLTRDTAENAPRIYAATSEKIPAASLYQALDNRLFTYTVGTIGEASIDLYLGKETEVSGIQIAWYWGDQTTNDFTVSASADGKTFTPVYSGASEKTLDLQTYRFDKPTSARFLRLTPTANSGGQHFRIAKINVL